MNEHKCCKYVGHLRKVIPKVIEKGGDATGTKNKVELIAAVVES